MKFFIHSQKLSRALFAHLEEIVELIEYPGMKPKKFAVLAILKAVRWFPFFPAKYRALVRGMAELLFTHDWILAIEQFQIAARLGCPSIDILMLGLSRAELNLRNYDASQALLELGYALEPKNSDVSYNLALMFLRSGKVCEATRLLMRSIALDHRYAMAHQNIAARYDRNTWVPTELDLIGDPDIHLYDAYHLIGQLLINAGDSKAGIQMFGEAMKLQSKLAKKYSLPQTLVKTLHQIEGFNPEKEIRIIPYEWVTQIGHLGMLDALLKMQRLGMRPDVNWVLLAPPKKVVNQEFLNCFKPYLIILSDIDLIDALFPYQRICGEQFNCYVDAEGQIIDWSDAAAQAFIEWDRQERAPLIRIPEAIKDFGKRRLGAMGMPEEAWFVTLHIRSSGYYGEGKSFIQKHRNASLRSYLPAIRLITRRGGWVVRMGDSSMPRLKQMPRVIDLAHSPYRAKALDVYLWSQARFFLGTTSGPTNAVVSFHTPSLLVNCISNYAQSWNSRVMFVLKPFWSQVEGRFLKMHEVFTPDFRAKMFNVRTLIREGVFPKANTAKEILAVTGEMIDLLDAGGLPKMQDSRPLPEANYPFWLWGNAHPSKRYFELRRKALIE